MKYFEKAFNNESDPDSDDEEVSEIINAFVGKKYPKPDELNDFVTLL